MGSVRQPEYRTRARPSTSQCSQPRSGTVPCRSCLPAKPTPFTSTSFKWSRAKAATAGLGLPRLWTRGRQLGRVRCRHGHDHLYHAVHVAEVQAACPAAWLQQHLFSSTSTCQYKKRASFIATTPRVPAQQHGIYFYS